MGRDDPMNFLCLGKRGGSEQWNGNLEVWNTVDLVLYIVTSSVQRVQHMVIKPLWLLLLSVHDCVIIFLQHLFIFGTERDRAWTGEGQRERGRHRIGNRLQALSHQPRARRGARTHGPWDRDLAEVGRLTDCATQAPHKWLTLNSI